MIHYVVECFILLIFVHCIVDVCDVLENLNGGTITMEIDGFLTKALYTCDTGYSLTGGSLLSCRADGSWDMSPPSCSKYCCRYCNN